MIGTTRPYLSFLVNQTDEGAEDGDAPRRHGTASRNQMDLFGDADEG
jgi:hypothetical protein